MAAMKNKNNNNRGRIKMTVTVGQHAASCSGTEDLPKQIGLTDKFRIAD
jgi:hypothetical protein